MSGCKAVTDAGVQSLALGCTRLQQLDLSSTSTGNRGYKARLTTCDQCASVSVSDEQVNPHLNGVCLLQPKT